LRPGVDRRDLEQVAALGLVKAARRYDGATNTPFEAYAWLTILGELLHYVRDHERALRVPRRLRVLEPRLGRAYDACVVRFGREPSESELAAEVGVPPGTLRELRRALAATQTLDLESVAGAEPRRVTGPGLEDRLLLTHALSTLRPLEARVVSGVYFAGLTQQEVAVQLGISARRISRIHQAALARMQRVIAS
jgi:RNA polymerase sigma-B factor